MMKQSSLFFLPKQRKARNLCAKLCFFYQPTNRVVRRGKAAVYHFLTAITDKLCSVKKIITKILQQKNSNFC